MADELQPFEQELRGNFVLLSRFTAEFHRSMANLYFEAARAFESLIDEGEANPDVFDRFLDMALERHLEDYWVNSKMHPILMASLDLYKALMGDNLGYWNAMRNQNLFCENIANYDFGMKFWQEILAIIENSKEGNPGEEL